MIALGPVRRNIRDRGLCPQRPRFPSIPDIEAHSASEKITHLEYTWLPSRHYDLIQEAGSASCIPPPRTSGPAFSCPHLLGRGDAYAMRRVPPRCLALSQARQADLSQRAAIPSVIPALIPEADRHQELVSAGARPRPPLGRSRHASRTGACSCSLSLSVWPTQTRARSSGAPERRNSAYSLTNARSPGVPQACARPARRWGVRPPSRRCGSWGCTSTSDSILQRR